MRFQDLQNRHAMRVLDLRLFIHVNTTNFYRITFNLSGLPYHRGLALLINTLQINHEGHPAAKNNNSFNTLLSYTEDDIYLSSLREMITMHSKIFSFLFRHEEYNWTIEPFQTQQPAKSVNIPRAPPRYTTV